MRVVSNRAPFPYFRARQVVGAFAGGPVAYSKAAVTILLQASPEQIWMGTAVPDGLFVGIIFHWFTPQISPGAEPA